MAIVGGVPYVFTNARSGTVMDLSGVDNRAIIGYGYHGGENQKWILEWRGTSWAFRSASTGLYLALDTAPANGTRLVATTVPGEWHIWHDEVAADTYRIFVPNTTYNLDLYNNGDPTPGTPITLWHRWSGVHQTWRIERV